MFSQCWVALSQLAIAAVSALCASGMAAPQAKRARPCSPARSRGSSTRFSEPEFEEALDCVTEDVDQLMKDAAKKAERILRRAGYY